MKNQIIEKPKDTVLLYREVISGAWKNWTDDEVEENLNSLKNSKDSCIIILQDDLQSCVRDQIVYDHRKITEAIQMIEGVPFDGHIEPKYIDPDMMPFVVNYDDEFSMETVEPNTTFLVCCAISMIGLIGYLIVR